MNFVQPILHHARTQGAAPALIDGERVITYGELAELVLRTAGHLAALGIRPGERIGICLKDNWRHIVAFLAAARLGAVPAPMDWRARSAEKARIAQTLALKVILVEPEERPIAAAAVLPVGESWEARVARAEPPSALPNEWHAPFLVGSTSGSTGIPKFSVTTHLNYFMRGVTLFDLLGPPRRRRRFLATLPLCFGGGRRYLLHLLKGDCVILHSALLSAEEYVALAARYEATIGLMVPTLLRQLLHLPAKGAPLLPGMEALLSVGAFFFAEEKREARLKLTPNIYDCYSVTATGIVAMLRPEEIADHAASVGRPHPLWELELVDERDSAVKRGEAGRLRLRGPALAAPLDPSAAAAGISEQLREGWYYPGEIASLDAEGYLFIQGRASEIVISGGAKISPAEIESVLQEHPAVAESAVVGRLSAENEEEVVAFVVAHGALGPGDLLGHLRMRLTGYKIPRDIRIVDRLPRLSSGKIDKRALSREAARLG